MRKILFLSILLMAVGAGCNQTQVQSVAESDTTDATKITALTTEVVTTTPSTATTKTEITKNDVLATVQGKTWKSVYVKDGAVHLISTDAQDVVIATSTKQEDVATTEQHLNRYKYTEAILAGSKNYVAMGASGWETYQLHIYDLSTGKIHDVVYRKGEQEFRPASWKILLGGKLEIEACSGLSRCDEKLTLQSASEDKPWIVQPVGNEVGIDINKEDKAYQALLGIYNDSGLKFSSLKTDSFDWRVDAQTVKKVSGHSITTSPSKAVNHFAVIGNYLDNNGFGGGEYNAATGQGMTYVGYQKDNIVCLTLTTDSEVKVNCGLLK